MFFAPWCGHCKRLMPTFDQFAEKYGDGVNINVGRVDCDLSENSNLCTAYDVGGFPTVLFLTGDHWYEFHGDRTIEGFSKFVFDKGYEAEGIESDVLPQRLEGWALYSKQIGKFTNQLAVSVNIIFHKIGFPQVPKTVQYIIAGSIFSIPVVLMMYVICCMKDEVYQVPIKKPAFAPVDAKAGLPSGPGKAG